MLLKAIRFFFVFLNGGEQCVVCGKKTGLLPLCGGCRRRFFSLEGFLERKRCGICGKELVSAEEFCSDCREQPILRHTDAVFPLFSYRLWNKELVFRWKVLGERSLSEVFAGFVATVFGELGIRVLVPVPPRKGKIREKGWDQIEELCTFLEHRFGFTVLRVLERSSRAEQKSLDRDGRLGTIGTAYTVKPACGSLPPEVCLLDDVLTTGATLESCSAALKQKGVQTVKALTLFIVD